jgi:hypothetical protein
VSEAQVALGDLPAALASQGEALVHDEALAAADPANAEGQYDLAWSLGSFASLLARSGERSRALAQVQRGLSLLEPLARKDSANAEVRLEHAKLLYQLAALKAATGDGTAGRRAFDEAQAASRALLESSPGDAETRSVLAERCADARRQLLAAGLPACAAR